MKVDWTSLSSLFNCVKAEALHLSMAPDFLARMRRSPKPLQFRLSAGDGFQLGSTVPDITVTSGAAVPVLVNRAAKSGLIAGESFHAPPTVPANTCVGMFITGSLDLWVSGLAGDLRFGMDKGTSVSLAFYKAFLTDTNQPTLANATGQMLSNSALPPIFPISIASERHVLLLRSGDIDRLGKLRCGDSDKPARFRKFASGRRNGLTFKMA